MDCSERRFEILSRPAGGRGEQAGRIPTPPCHARRLARRLLERAGPAARFLDPACGGGELLLALREELGGLAQPGRLHGIEVAAELARDALARLGESGSDIRTGDALDPAALWPPRTWIVANPPWVSWSGRHRGAGTWNSRHGALPGGWPCLQSAFLERIAQHVARQGTGAAVLLPGSMMELERYGPMRLAVTRVAHPRSPPEELGESSFPGVLEPAVLLELAPGSPIGGPSEAPWTGPPRAGVLLAELARRARFPAGAFGDPGVHTGNAARELVRPAGGAAGPALRQGRDLRAYQLGPASASLALEPPERPGAYYRIGSLASYEALPILLRQTADRPIAALHLLPSYFRNSLLACRGVAGLDPAFVVAVLNSPTAAAWHRLQHRDARQRTFPQVKVGHLATQPLPLRERAEAPRLHDEIVERVRALLHAAPERIEKERIAIEERIVASFALSARAMDELETVRVELRERAHSRARST